MRSIVSSFLLCFFALPGFSQNKTLIVFFDGLRPDYITEKQMPRLYAFKNENGYGNQHHSVFPTVTRVNASSYATGSYPAAHGILGNSVYFPQVDSTRPFDTGEAQNLMRISDSLHGKLLTMISLGELVQQAGKKMMVFSSGSSGQALLQNHKIAGGAVVNTSMILPASFQPEIEAVLGKIPAKEKPNTPQHKWVTDALIRFGFAENGPLVNAIWFSDPDGTAHADGIGAPSSIASILSVDREFGRILDSLEARGMRATTNILISTDHGFVTHQGKESVGEFLVKQGLKKDKDSDDVILAGGAIYVKNHDKILIGKIASVLQQQPWVGAVFSPSPKPGSMQGWVPGTLSFESIHWNHPERAADLLVDMNWNDSTNENGYKGFSYSRGVAGHGTLSPYEVNIPFIAGGPDFKKKFRSEAPTSNVDIVPTVLALQGIVPPAGMNGRILEEFLLKGKKSTVKPATEVLETSVVIPGGKYTLQLHRTVYGKYRYVDFSKVKR